MENQNKRNNKKEERLCEKLKSEDLRIARAALERIRKEGRLEDIPEIIEALRMQKKEGLKKELQDLLCDIQVSGAAGYIIEGIKDPVNKPVLAELLSVCWESRHDFSGYLEVFISNFLNAEFEASLEAFTTIEKIFHDHKMKLEKLVGTIDIIKTSYPDLSSNKRQLALILIESLEEIRDQP